MKKLIAILLALLVASMPLAAQAEDTVYSEGYFYYTFADGSITITGYFGSETTVTVPNSIAGYPVNTIASGAFADTTVKELYLPDTIMVIQEGATGDAHVHFAGGNAEPDPTATPTPAPTAKATASVQTTPKPTETPKQPDAQDDEVTIEDPEEDATPAPTKDTTIREGNGIVIASAEPTAEPTATPVPTDAPTDKPTATYTEIKTVTVTPVLVTEQKQVAAWIWIAIGVCAAIAAGFVIAKRKKK